MVLRSIKVDQGTITYQDRRTGLTIDIRNFQLDMTSGPPSILTLRSPTCRITYGRRAIESKVRLQAILDDPVRIQLMEWMSDGLTLSMKNQVLNTKALAFDVDGRLDAAKFLQATGIRSLVDAQVDFTADFDLPARRMRVTAHSNRLRTASIQMDDINGECAIAADGTSDAHITTRIAGGRAGLQMATDHGKTRADIQLEQVDPRQLPPVSKRLPITPATTISGKVRLDWRGLLQPVDLRGHTELVLNSSHAAKGEMPLTGQFSADYEKGALQIRPSRVHVGSAAAVDFEGSLAPKAIDLQFSAGVVEIKQFLKDTIGDRIALPEKLSGTASLVGRLSGDGSSLAARFESPLIHLGGKEISNISSSIDVAGRTIEISDFQCRTLGGTLSGHGSIREKDYSAYLRGESLHLSTLSPIFTEGIIEPVGTT